MQNGRALEAVQVFFRKFGLAKDGMSCRLRNGVRHAFTVRFRSMRGPRALPQGYGDRAPLAL